MPEQELNKYYEQARQATLAQIAGNQEQLVMQQQNGIPMAQMMRSSEELNAPLPAGPEIPAGQAQVQDPAGPYRDRGLEAMPAGPSLPTAQAEMQAAPAPVGFDDWLASTEEEAQRRSRQLQIEQTLDPRVMRAENSRKWIAGIGDALASIANMVGTGNDASNQPQTYMLPGVNAAVEQERARRTAAYQKQVDRMNQLILQQAKDKAAADRQAATIAAADARAAADRAAREKQNERDFQYKKQKDDRDFEYKQGQDDIKNDLAAKKQANDEWYRGQQVAIGWARANKGDNPSGSGDGGGNEGRYSGKRGGGMKDAKVDYNLMLDEIAESRGCESWADLANRAQTDRELRRVYNQFDFDQHKGSPSQIEHKISTYARNWAPKFHAYYFGGNVDDDVDLDEGSWGGGEGSQADMETLARIKNSSPGKGKKKKNGK